MSRFWKGVHQYAWIAGLFGVYYWLVLLVANTSTKTNTMLVATLGYILYGIVIGFVIDRIQMRYDGMLHPCLILLFGFGAVATAALSCTSGYFCSGVLHRIQIFHDLPVDRFNNVSWTSRTVVTIDGGSVNPKIFGTFVSAELSSIVFNVPSNPEWMVGQCSKSTLSPIDAIPLGSDGYLWLRSPTLDEASMYYFAVEDARKRFANISHTISLLTIDSSWDDQPVWIDKCTATTWATVAVALFFLLFMTLIEICDKCGAISSLDLDTGVEMD